MMSLTVIRPLSSKRVVDDEHPFQAVLVHQGLGFLQLRAFGHGHQPIALGHDAGHRLVEIGLEAQVAVGHDADDLAAVDDRQTGDLVLLGKREHLAHRHRRAEW